ncbi:hypothetical protein BDZ89DRAFT_1133022 [Hymenopellis radicata]|nr:hypothetical protein BDZ89DRAFT_1133022 [Hymenopellis radicata]
MPLVSALSGASRMTRSALKAAVARVFGPGAEYALRAQDDGQYALSVAIEDLALARHEDQDDLNRNEDPAVNRLLASPDFLQTLTTES